LAAGFKSSREAEDEMGTLNGCPSKKTKHVMDREIKRYLRTGEHDHDCTGPASLYGGTSFMNSGLKS